ncbi:TetR/AcrR family transcriptional regulator [Nocardia sp. alder85J]|uniref:TetR/AcrR family transcriptional regulator n=1 Tax=Nocardia sp. alder85J TaxID=2862949 RepID=UPI001CD283A5|nr:TetR/AcrR family transcriptional regulator [Nocardia sp. alder85J]MCX4099192.1 TetR/AcrR family transcriptional regulator [Nocardia sp. alder85J]
MGVRERVLEAALACFLEDGYERTTIARIRERSAVSNGALFHHFPTKEAIAGELYVDSMRAVQDGYRRVLAAGPRTLAEAVAGVVRHQLGWIEAHPDRARFVYSQGRLDLATEAGHRLRAMNDELAAEYRRRLAPLIARGEVRDLPMTVVVAVITGPAHGIAQQWLAGQLAGPIGEYADDLIDAAVAGLTGTPTAGPRHPPRPVTARIRIEVLDDDGTVVAAGTTDTRLASPAE